MSWTPVSNSAIDIKKEKGKDYIGVYNGYKTIKTKLGDQFIYSFTDAEEGTTFSIYGFTNLNRVMESVREGQMVKVTYMGTKNVQTKYGMKDVHQCEVFTDTAIVGA